MTDRIKPSPRILRVLLPPYAVYLDRGFGRAMVLAGVLTLCAYVPGVAYAWWVARRKAKQP